MALDLLDRVSHRGCQYCRATSFRCFNNFVDFFRRDERTHTIVNRNDYGFTDRIQTVAYRLRPRLSSADKATRLTQSEFLRERLKTRRIFGGQHRDYFVDLFTVLESLERVNDYRNAAQLEKLFWPSAAQPRSFAGSHDYGDVHSLKLRYR